MQIFVLGVAGVIGSGKSVFCHFLQKHFGFHYINADKIVHQLYLAGNEGYKKIKEIFGKKFIGRGSVDRKKLRETVSKNPEKLLLLNKIMHSLVAKEVNKKIVQIKRDSKGKSRIFICIEAFYFDKKNLGKFIDQVVVLDAPDEIILKRLKKRNISASQLKKILKLQRMLK
ncbi:dephospho-CoA kinase [Candidatus Peregrinibacteria bacterium]|nr:dephospho-CoA kinase [Candidatus Peregrinibacteria bacterium]